MVLWPMMMMMTPASYHVEFERRALFITLVSLIQESDSQMTPKLKPVTPIPAYFQWCNKSECISANSIYNFYKVEDLIAVRHDTSYELHMGLWSTHIINIWLLPNARKPQSDESYYRVELMKYNNKIAKKNRNCRIISNGRSSQERKFPVDQALLWGLTDTEYRPFFIRVTRDETSVHIIIGADDKIIMEIKDDQNKPAIDYIAFDCPQNSQGKVIFGCPPYSEAKFLPSRHAAPVLRQLDMSMCPICDQCPIIYLPVCASNMKTYRNACLFQCQVNDTKITILNKGICMHWLWQMQ